MNSRRTKFLVLGMAALLFTGCATTPVLRKAIERERLYTLPTDQVWETAIYNLARSGAIIHTTDKSSGLITYTRILSGDELRNFTDPRNLGTPFGGGFRQGSGYMNLLVRAEEDSKTRVFINGRIQISSTLLSGRGEPVTFVHYATSNGRMEEEFLDQLSVELGDKEFKWLKKEEGGKAPEK